VQSRMEFSVTGQGRQSTSTSKLEVPKRLQFDASTDSGPGPYWGHHTPGEDAIPVYCSRACTQQKRLTMPTDIMRAGVQSVVSAGKYLSSAKIKDDFLQTKRVLNSIRILRNEFLYG